MQVKILNCWLWIRILQILTSDVEPKTMINTGTFPGVYNHLVNKLCNKLHLFHTKPGGFVKILRTLKSAKFFFSALYCRKLRRNFRYLSAVPRWQISQNSVPLPKCTSTMPSPFQITENLTLKLQVFFCQISTKAAERNILKFYHLKQPFKLPFRQIFKHCK